LAYVAIPMADAGDVVTAGGEIDEEPVWGASVTRPACQTVGTLGHVATLDLDADVVSLTASLVDIPSESFREEEIADSVERALQRLGHLKVRRHGNSIVASTSLGLSHRVVIAGHLDTVPVADNLPARLVLAADVPDDEGPRTDRLYGLGSCDMKGGVAVALKCAYDIARPSRDVTYVFYEAEEVEDVHNGLGQIASEHPDWLAGEFAVLMEPTAAGIEGGCQGTLRVRITTGGRRAHSARSWLGDNAIHRATDVLVRLRDYLPSRVEIDGMEYREGLSAVGIQGGVAGNVIPDECVVTINYRYAPTRTPAEAVAHVEQVFGGFAVEVVDNSPGALPGLAHPVASAFVAAIGSEARPKFGWTDVSRFTALNVPAVNYGPGDPSLAHTREEYVPVQQLIECEARMKAWLQT